MAGGFKKLKQLDLDKFDELRFVEIQKGAMSGIEKLSIQRCKWLQKVPLGIENLTELKVLEFFDMPMKKEKTIGELHTFLKCIQPIGETGAGQFIHWRVLVNGKVLHCIMLSPVTVITAMV